MMNWYGFTEADNPWTASDDAYELDELDLDDDLYHQRVDVECSTHGHNELLEEWAAMEEAKEAQYV